MAPPQTPAAAPATDEERSLLSAVDEVSEAAPGTNASRRRALAGFAVVVIGAAALVVGARAPSGPGGLAARLASREDEDGASVVPAESVPLAYELHNYYTESTKRPMGQEYPWLSRYKLAEPHHETWLRVTGTLADAERQYHFAWLKEGEAMGGGLELTYHFNTTGRYEIALQAVNKRTLDVEYTATDYVWVKYVRRELRGMNDEDREAWFAAMEVVFKTPCTDGKIRYGDEFECIDTFTSMHNDFAGDSYCDHAHDGYGFLTMHFSLSVWFEQTLQSVDPKVSLPYWDYTIDMHAVDQAGGNIDIWRDSIVWSDTWFGTASPKRDDHIVDTGRFAYTPVRTGARNTTMNTNSYGMMRAPWNNNRAAFVTRSNTSYGFQITDMPGCASHHNVLQYTNFSDFGFHIMYNPHGTTHLAIGGVWNADWHKKLLLADYDMVQAPSWTLLGFAKQKNMFRAGFSVCPSICAMDTPEEDCKCACEDVETKINDKKYLRILEKIMEGYLPYLNDREGNYLGDEIYKLLCNYYTDTYPVMGDSLESASPADVSFWPTHPTVDRLFQWRRLNGMGMHWPDNSAWSVEGTRTAYCHGHNIDDVLPFTGLFDDEAGPYTNRELLSLADPGDSKAPYIYDNFEWPHCLDEGYSVDLLTQSNMPDSNVRAARIPASKIPWGVPPHRRQ